MKKVSCRCHSNFQRVIQLGSFHFVTSGWMMVVWFDTEAPPEAPPLRRTVFSLS